MREGKCEIEVAKSRVKLLAGQNIVFKVNKGRNKFVRFNGSIENIYPSIFTVNAVIDDEIKLLSYSYNDVLTKAVRFFPNEEEKNFKA